MKLLSNKIAISIKDSLFTQPAIEDVLKLLEKQQPLYQNLEYLSNSFQSLILKAIHEDQQVALKIVMVQDHIQEIETVKKEYEFLKSMNNNSYFILINNCFYLTEGGKEKYFIIDMEICKCNFNQFLQDMRKDKVEINDQAKETLAIQMLDALNMLHNKEILHKNITPNNIFISSFPQNKDIPLIIKLSDIGLSSQHKIKNSKSLLAGKKRPKTFFSIEASKGKFKKQSDLYSLGLIILELDNYLTFEYSKISQKEECSLQEEGIKALSAYELNRNSYLFQVAEVLLNPYFKMRQSAFEMLERLLQKEQNENIFVYSILTEYSVLSSKQLPIPQLFDKKRQQQLENLNSQIERFLKKEKNYFELKSCEGKELHIHEHQKFESLMKRNSNEIILLDKIQEDHFISPENIQLALKALYKLKKFSLFSYLGRGDLGVVFSVKNLEKKRISVIKISLANSKIMRQISILKKVYSPSLVKFYDYGLFKDERDNQYVWLEYEKCLCSLTHYLNLNKEGINNSPDLKISFAMQIIDSINFLHKQGIFYGDIKLDNFMIQEDEQGRTQIKLNDQNSSILLSESVYEDEDNYHRYQLLAGKNCLYLKGKYATPAYRSPESQFCRDYPITFLTESFSIGICLLLLDNYSLFEKVLVNNHFDLLQPYEVPFNNYLHLINTDSQIYKWAIALLTYNPRKRLLLRQIIDQIEDSSTSLSSKSISEIPLKEMCLKAPCLFLKNIQQGEVIKIINSNAPKLQVYLSFLSLDLQSSNIQSDGMTQLASALSKLVNLVSLTLNIQSNNIQSEGMIQLSLALSKIAQLQYLTLSLNNNNIQDEGMISLASAISKQIFLQSLTLNLNCNKIQSEGIIQFSPALSKLVQLKSLTLNLNFNKIQSLGTTQLSQALSHLIQLSTLTLSLQNNNIQSNGIKDLSIALSKLVQIQSLSLNLFNNNIESRGMIELSSDLKNLIQIESLLLHLSGNMIENDKIMDFTSFLSYLPELLSLTIDLSINKIQNEGVIQLSQILSKLEYIKSLTLDLDYNNIQSEGIIELSQALSKLISLQSLTLSLHNNKIQSIGMIKLAQGISYLIQLSSLTLCLSENSILSEGMYNLQSALSNLAQLSSLTLYLQNNNFQIEGTIELSKAIFQLISLQSLTLFLTNNNIQNEGIILLSLSLTQLTQLQSLTLILSSNHITREGTIDFSLSLQQLNQLDFLMIDLSNNKIETNKKNLKLLIKGLLPQTKKIDIYL